MVKSVKMLVMFINIPQIRDTLRTSFQRSLQSQLECSTGSQLTLFLIRRLQFSFANLVIRTGPEPVTYRLEGRYSILQTVDVIVHVRRL